MVETVVQALKIARRAAPQVFIDDAECKNRWASRDRYYLVVEKPSTPRLEQLLGKERLFLVRESGGKYLFSNEPN